MTSEEQTVMESPPDTHAGLYLTFALAEEMYGVEILAAQEIIQMVPITAVPRTPEFVRGVINLRGRVIPVVDLRRKFEMEPTDDTSQTCIVVVEAGADGHRTTMGIVVDQVAEVLDVTADQIEPPPALGAAVDTAFMHGMGKVGEEVVMLLDIRQVLAGGELAMLDQVARAENAQ